VGGDETHDQRAGVPWAGQPSGPSESPTPWAGPSPPVGEIEPEPAPRRSHAALIAGIVAVVLVAGAIVVAVVATQSDSKSAAVVLSSAPARTTSAGTAHFELTTSASLAGENKALLKVSSDIDFKHKAAELQVGTPDGQLVEQLRVVDGVTYVSSPRVQVPGGAHWVKITPADIKSDTQLGAQLGNTDPSSGLQYLSVANAKPQVVGTEQLDGTKVTHYRFTIDVERLLQAEAQGAKALGVGNLAAGLSQFGKIVDLTKLPTEAWIDGAGRVHRVTLTISITEAGETAQAVDDIRYSRFGEPVDVTAPPADDVVPFSRDRTFFSDLAGGAQG
jgi:hypothetical protein